VAKGVKIMCFLDDSYWDNFEDDFGLGKTPKRKIVSKKQTQKSGTRLIVLAGTFNFNQTMSAGNVNQLQVDVKKYLTQLGYGIGSIKMERAFFSTASTIELEVIALNTHSNEQIRQMITNAISSYERWWINGNFQVITDLKLKVVSDFSTTTTQQEVTQQQNSLPSVPNLAKKITSKTSSAVYDAASKVGNTALETVKDSATNMFGNMGYTLPIAAVVTTVVLIIALKK
jgi:hypothetical protein